MQSNKEVSIIIPVFNRHTLLSRAVRSILNQTHKYFELIIVNDGSDEDIDYIAASFKDKRIRCINNSKNRGVSYSRNIGIKNAKYDLIALLDSDDEWLLEKMEKQLVFFENNPHINVVHTEEIWIRNSKRVNQKKRHKKSGGDIFIPSLELCLISPSSVLLKKEVFEKYGVFDESLPVCEDYDMWLRITANEEVGFIEEPLVIKYGGHPDQLSRKYPAMDRYRVMSMIKLHNTYKLDDRKEKALRTMIAKKSKILLNGALKRGKTDDAKLYQSWYELNLSWYKE